MGHTEVSTTHRVPRVEKAEQAADASWHAPFWQKPLLESAPDGGGGDAAHRVVVGSYWQRSSQHSPSLHSAPAMSRQPVQQAEESSHSSPASTTPLPQLGEVATHVEASSHAPATSPSAVHAVPEGIAP